MAKIIKAQIAPVSTGNSSPEIGKRKLSGAAKRRAAEKRERSAISLKADMLSRNIATFYSSGQILGVWSKGEIPATCLVCGHQWEARRLALSQGKNCPKCSPKATTCWTEAKAIDLIAELLRRGIKTSYTADQIAAQVNPRTINYEKTNL